MEIAIIVQVDVKPSYIQEFINETKKSQSATLNEDGCLRYNILQSIEEPNKFTLSEIYKSEEAIEVHRTTQHFLDWRNNVQVMMAAPRIGVKHKIV